MFKKTKRDKISGSFLIVVDDDGQFIRNLLLDRIEESRYFFATKPKNYINCTFFRIHLPEVDRWMKNADYC